MKIETKLAHFVDSFDFDEFVKSQYTGTTYEFVPDQEANNDTSYVFEVTGDLNSYEQSDLDDFEENNETNLMARVLLNTFAFRELIPKGTYVIGVVW